MVLAGVRLRRGMVGKCCRWCVGVVRLVDCLGRLCVYGSAGGSCGVRAVCVWIRFLSLSLMKAQASAQSMPLEVR